MAKRKLLNLRIIGNSEELLNQFIEQNKESIFKEAYNGIKQAMRQNKSIAEICSVNTNSAIATIPKEGWENALSSSLGYFVSVEDFEMCKDIDTTLKMLRYGKRSTRFTKEVTGSVVAG
jgi:hypothetical protein